MTRARAGTFLLWGMAWALVCAGAWVLGADPDPGLVALALLAAAATWAVLRAGLSGDEAGEAQWRAVVDEPVRSPGSDRRMNTLVRLVDQHLVARAPGDQLPRLLVHLADQRLVARHGLSRLADPDRAAAVLGPDLAALAERVEHGPPGARLSPAAIDRLLTRIEAL